MATAAIRLIGRIQRRWQFSAADTAGRITADELAELTARLQRLQSIDHRCAHVQISPDVACVDAAGMRDRVGGECVTTEV